uniref:Uncharacterized protein LOC104242233 n=1 Tax=Nicotiana sylvestris TaxID=4096 RepID=A0A1U7Y8I3_NICSY|nr:PREDICTED: uncharacterized protein LOC104242233 [Nicotiana sylvestris]
MVKECPNNDMTEAMIQKTFYWGINTNNQCVVNQLAGGNFMTTPYAEACEILDEMEDTSSAWQSRANAPQGDSNMIKLHKELYDHGQAIAELTTTMNQLAKAQLQKVQGPKQVNAIEGFSMMVNKRRQKGPQVQNHVENFVQNDSGFDQDEPYNEQEEEDGNNTGHAMAVTTRIGKGRDVTTSSQKKIVDDEQLVQEDEMSSNKLQVNDEVRTDIYDNVEETKVEVNPSREHIIDISEPVMLKAKAPMPRPPHPHPKRLAKKNGENQFKKFIDIMKSLSINVPLVEALEQMPSYAKLMKDLVTKKRSMNCETIKMTHQVHSLAPKLEDSVFKTLGVGKPRPKSIRLQMSDRTMKRPLGIIDDILVLVDKFIFPADFVFLDCEVDYKVPIILGRPFLTTRKALVDLEAGELTFRFGDDKVVSMYASRLHIGGATKEEEVYLMEFGGYLGDKSGILHDGLQNTDWNVPIPVGVWEDCHLPVELDHKDMWDLKKLNLAWDVAANLRVAQLNELDEFRNEYAL